MRTTPVTTSVCFIHLIFKFVLRAISHTLSPFKSSRNNIIIKTSCRVFATTVHDTADNTGSSGSISGLSPPA